MKNRPLAILLIAIIAIHAFAGGAGDSAVLCLGGGHEHAPAEEEQCELACSHDGSVPLPLQVYSSEHNCDCDCNDIEFTFSDLLALPRNDDGSAISPVIVFAPVWGVVVADSGLGRRGPPMQSHWIDHGGVHRLEIVTSVRLNI